MSICWYKPCYGAFAILADKNPTATDYPVGMCISPHGSSVVAETPNDMLVLEHTDRHNGNQAQFILFLLLLCSHLLNKVDLRFRHLDCIFKVSY